MRSRCRIRQAINARKQQSEIPRPAPALPSAYGLASVDPRRCGIADTIDKHRCAVVLGTPIEGTKPAQISISIPQRLGASAPMPPVDDGAAVATMMMKEYLANSDSPTNSQAGSRKGGKGKKAEGIGRSFEAAFIEKGQ